MSKAKNTAKSETKAVAKKGFVNPYRQGTNYFAITEALATKANKPMTFAEMKAAVAKIMGREAWNEFVNRKPRNKKTAKNVDERVAQNASVLTRPDYGAPLKTSKAEIVITKIAKGQHTYMLKTK